MRAEFFGKAIDYVVNDLTHHYGLNEEVSVTISGDGVNEIFGNQERMICTDKLTIWSDTTGNKVVLTAHPFTASEKCWNGANLIPNTDYESMLASLFHDLLYKNMAHLTKQLPDCEEWVVRKWADQVLYTIWAGASRSKFEKIKARIGYGVCRMFGGIFTSLTKWFIFLVAILSLVGCCVPDWTLEDVDNGEEINRVINEDK